MSSIALAISLAYLIFVLPASTAPVHSEPNVHCQCETLTGQASKSILTSEGPVFSADGLVSPCSSLSTRWLDWRTARQFADDHGVPLIFETRSAAKKVLDAQHPLPTSVLLALSKSSHVDSAVTPAPRSGEEWFEEKSRLVCKSSDPSPATIFGMAESRIKDRLNRGDGRRSDVYVLQIVLWLILIVVLYEAADATWTCLRRRFFPEAQDGLIKLSGKEKELKAEYNDHGETSRPSLEHLPASIA